jgi:hypothetical protein
VIRQLKDHLTRRSSPRTFAAAVLVALLVMPVAEALAFYGVSGSGTIGPAPVSATGTTVGVSIGGGTAFTFSGGSTTNYVLGGSSSSPIRLTCLTSCPATVAHVNLSSFTSDKAGCNSTSLPGAFTAPGLVPVPSSIPATATDVGSITINYVSLSVDQSACLGANVTFTLTAS